MWSCPTTASSTACTVSANTGSRCSLGSMEMLAIRSGSDAPGLAVDRSLFDIEVRQADAMARALEHVMDESYGLCTDCRAEIPFERLRVEPEAVRCVGCETRHERLLAGMR